jgi:predicted small secreted protein
MKKMIMVLSVICSVFIISGCNTVHGFGEDVSAGGKALSNSANKVQSEANK